MKVKNKYYVNVENAPEGFEWIWEDWKKNANLNNKKTSKRKVNIYV